MNVVTEFTCLLELNMCYEYDKIWQYLKYININLKYFRSKLFDGIILSEIIFSWKISPGNSARKWVSKTLFRRKKIRHFFGGNGNSGGNTRVICIECLRWPHKKKCLPFKSTIPQLSVWLWWKLRLFFAQCRRSVNQIVSHKHLMYLERIFEFLIFYAESCLCTHYLIDPC